MSNFASASMRSKVFAREAFLKRNLLTANGLRSAAVGALAIFMLQPPSPAIAADGVSGLLTDVTPLLSVAGGWQPIDNQYITANCPGSLASTFSDAFTVDSSVREHLIITGWSYCGFNNTATSITPVRVAMLRQQSDGTLRLDTSSFIADSQTNGSGSVIVADFNSDGYSDIFLAAHNESPFIGMPSTALLSNRTGGFNKVTLNDRVMAHDAQLATINGKPTVFTRTFGNGGADRSPYYQFVNGAFTSTFAPGISGDDTGTKPKLTGQSGAVGPFGAGGAYELLDGDATFVAGAVSTSERMIAVYPFDGFDAQISQKIQNIPGYFNSRAQYANISSYWGPHQTHTYRLKTDDFNHDGSLDVVGLASLWDGTNSFPAVLQMLQNDGTGRFQDVSDTLAASVNPQTSESDYEFRIRDLDNSQIGSYLSATQGYDTSKPNTTNYLLVNDGSGTLYVALRETFDTWTTQIAAYFARNMPAGYTCSSPRPSLKFIPYKTENGKLNYLVLNPNCISNTPVSGSYPNAYVFVNLPIQLDLSTMMRAPMAVQSRNGSRLIRTFGGNDTISAATNSGTARVDGGAGTDRAIYSGPRANYTVHQNDDGSWAVVDKVGNNGTDTLVNVESAQFTDTTVTLTNTKPIRMGAIFSTSQSESQSFLRFYNTGATAGTVSVTLSDHATGQSLGQWTSPSIPVGTSPQFSMTEIETALTSGTTKPSLYSVTVQPRITGFTQHVLWRPNQGTFTNLSTCSTGVTANRDRLNNVHTSNIDSGYPSSVIVHNTGTTAAAAILAIYRATDGVKVGSSYTTASIAPGGQAVIAMKAIETAAGIKPGPSDFHYVVRFEGTYNGFLQHLVENVQVNVTTDMTTVCALSGEAAASSSSPLRMGAIFSTSQTDSQSFLRFYNTGSAAGTVRVTLSNYTTGQSLGQWTSPSIPAGASPQYSMAEVETALTQGTTKPALYSVTVQPGITGYTQHVLWRPNQGTFTNLSTCSAGVTANRDKLNNVHASLIDSGYPSSVIVHNTGATAAAATLAIYRATDGVKLGTTYTTASIAPGGQAIIAMKDIETATGITPEAPVYHYVVKFDAAFTGFLQHLVENVQADVTTDMTTVCALPQ